MPDWDGPRSFRVERAVTEARGVRSLYLRPAEGPSALPGFRPGQYLTFELQIPGQPRPLVRCYSLSDAPTPEHYRVSVKREENGQGSSAMHRLGVGDRVAVRAPSGVFTLAPDDPPGPAVLVGAGIGLTPLLSMVEAHVAARSPRPLHLFLGFRNGDEHPFRERLARLARDHGPLTVTTAYSQPRPADQPGRDYDYGGRLSVDLLEDRLPPGPAQFFLCGPPAFLEGMVEGLDRQGVSPQDLHLEAFGAPSVQRVRKPLQTARLSRKLVEPEGPARVTFAKAGTTVDWQPDSEAILYLGQQHDAWVPYACGAGRCGTCLVRLLEGNVSYSVDPEYAIPPGGCLPCIARPAGDVSLDM
jgi:uncharacterized protein